MGDTLRAIDTQERPCACAILPNSCTGFTVPNTLETWVTVTIFVRGPITDAACSISRWPCPSTLTYCTLAPVRRAICCHGTRLVMFHLRSDCEHCQLVFVQLGNVIYRHVRLVGQGFNGSLVRGAFARMRGRRKPVHLSLSSCVAALPGCKSSSMPLEPGMSGRHQPVEKLLEPAVCFRPYTPFPCPLVQPYPATPRTRSHRGARGRRVL
jgi:hypothetical protein